MLHHVFLSYSRKDTPVMERVRTTLRDAGLDVWTDEGIEPGTSFWKDAIEDAIENSRCLVVLLSPDAKDSIWVKREIDYASGQGVKIYPVMIHGNEKNAVPFALTGSQWVDIRNEANYDFDMNRLIETICDYLGIKSRSRIQQEEKARIADKKRHQAEQIQLRKEAQERAEQARLKEDARHQAESSQKNDTIQSTESHDAKSVSESRPNVQPTGPVPVKQKSTSLPPPEPAQQPPPTPPITPVSHLTPWNPLDQLRLLWWLFITPGRYIAYESTFGPKTAIKAGAWMVSTLIWLPPIILLAAFNLNRIPLSKDLPVPLLLPAAIIGWLLTGWFGYRNNKGAFGVALGIAGGIAFGIALGVAGGVAGSTAVVVAFGVALGVAGGIADGVAAVAALGVAFGVAFSVAGGVTGGVAFSVVFVVAGGVAFVATGGIAFIVAFETRSIEENMTADRSLFLHKVMLVMLLLAYAALIWIYFLGGWQVLAFTS